MSLFARRKLVSHLAVGAGALLVILAAGIVVSTVFAIGQTRARDEAERQAKISQAMANFFTNTFIEMIEGDYSSIQDVLDAASEKIEGKFEDEPLRIKNLRQTRDLLLPKLISGELDVSELDIETGETKNGRVC